MAEKVVEPGKLNMFSNDDPRKIFLDEVKNIIGDNEICLDDNFFDVGGDSLIAAELQANLDKSNNWRSPQLDEIIEAATFGDLYERICIRNHPSK